MFSLTTAREGLLYLATAREGLLYLTKVREGLLYLATAREGLLYLTVTREGLCYVCIRLQLKDCVYSNTAGEGYPINPELSVQLRNYQGRT